MEGLRRFSHVPDAWNIAGAIFAMTGEVEKAARLFAGCILSMPDNLAAFRNLAQVHAGSQDYRSVLIWRRRARAVCPKDPDLAVDLGNVLREMGQIDDALALHFWAAGQNRLSPEIALSLGVTLSRVGRWREAAAAVRRTLALLPSHEAAWRAIGIILRELREPACAVAAFRRSFPVIRQDADMLSNLAEVCLEIGHSNDAVCAAQRGLAVDAGHFSSWVALGNSLVRLGRFADALASYGRALARNPGRSIVCLARGMVLLALGRPGEALRSFDRILNSDLSDVGAHVGRGSALLNLKQYDRALSSFHRAMALSPGLADFLSNVGTAHFLKGERRRAVASFKRALAVNAEHADARWKSVLCAIPVVAETSDDISEVRENLLSEFSALATWMRERLDAHEIVGLCSLFYLAYQETSNREILSAYGALCTDAMAKWSGEQGLTMTTPAKAEPVRVGIVSAHVRSHSVWNALVKGWLKHLDGSKVEVHIFDVGDGGDDETSWAESRCKSFIKGPRQLREWVDLIQKRDLHVLIYPEIGMDPMTIRLAALRLVGTQVASWGHPETTGMKTIDYFLSAEALEPSGADGNYTEKLVLLPKLGACYEPLNVLRTSVRLSDYGVYLDTPILICPGVPFKYAPENDRVFVDIAANLGACQFLFFMPPQDDALSDAFRRRMDAEFSRHSLDFSSFSRFIPWLDAGAFHGLLEKSDVYLDTIGFSGFNTAMQAVECDLPIVTVDGKFLRGRFASGILKQMDLAELVASNRSEYSALATKLVTNPTYRRQIRRKMAASKARLFNDTSVVRALERFLTTVGSSNPQTSGF